MPLLLLLPALLLLALPLLPRAVRRAITRRSLARAPQGSAKLLNAHSKRSEDGGRTLLHVAAWWGCHRVLEYLLLLGALVNAIDTAAARTTPLFEAVRAGHRPIAEELIANGADVRHQDAHGDTALHWAARRGWGTIMVAVLRAGEKAKANSTKDLISVTNFKGQTPFDVARGETVKELIVRELKFAAETAAGRMKTVSRVKRGLLKAKMMGAQVGGEINQLKAQVRGAVWAMWRCGGVACVAVCFCGLLFLVSMVCVFVCVCLCVCVCGT